MRVRHPRLLAALAALGFVAATRAAWPDGGQRAAAQYALVITLGYGHLLGAALPTLRRAATRGALACAWLAAAAATAYALYAAAARAWPPLVLGLVGLSVWHIAENDAALVRALRAGGPLPALPRTLPGHTRPLAASALVLAAAAFSLPDAGRFGDVFSAVTLYHLVAWLGFALARGTSAGRLAALHAAPALACAALSLAPEGGALRSAVFSPGLYLFWSALHVLQTARARAAA
jgi:hypothetical protein